MSKYESSVSYKDIPTILLENRIIMLVGEINDETAYRVTSCLHILNKEDPTEPIQLFIDSPGGVCTSGISIIDTMNFISAPVYTIVTGMAASMGAAILSAGEKGHRYALPNATIMCHQAIGGSGYQSYKDAKIAFKEFERINDLLAKIIAENCGKTKEEYLEAVDRDNYMDTEAALKFGIIDKVYKSEKELSLE